MEQLYAKHKEGGDTIYECTIDEDGFYDISIDDIQGDITILGVPRSQLIFVNESEYTERIKELSNNQ